MTVKYSILTPSVMEVMVDEKKVLIQGEGTTEPKFYADARSLEKWEPPYENQNITAQEKHAIISAIEEKSKNSKVPVVFD
jgi:glutaredoxin